MEQEDGMDKKPLLRVATVKDDFLIQDAFGRFELIGPMRKILDVLAEKYDYTISVPKDNEYGVFKNNSWTGMVGMLHRDEADVALALFTATYERYRVVDYSGVFVMDSTNILSSKSQGSVQEIMDNFKEIDFKVWIAVGVTVLVISVISSLMDRIMASVAGFSYPGIIKSTENNFLANVASMLLNDFSLSVRSSSAQCAACGLWLGLFVYTTLFTSVIQSSFVVSSQGMIIDSLDVLLKAKKTMPTVFKGTSTHYMFLETDSGIFKDVGDKMRNNPSSFVAYDSLKEKSLLYEDVVKKSRALIATLDLLTLEGKKACGEHPTSLLHLSTHNYFISKVSITIRKTLRPDMKESINELVRRTFNTGILTFWLQEIYGNLPVCFQEGSSDVNAEVSALELQPLAKLFQVLLAGMAVATLVLILEHITHFLATCKMLNRKKIRQ